jgi:hypothetical protein
MSNIQQGFLNFSEKNPSSHVDFEFQKKKQHYTGVLFREFCPDEVSGKPFFGKSQKN